MIGRITELLEETYTSLDACRPYGSESSFDENDDNENALKKKMVELKDEYEGGEEKIPKETISRDVNVVEDVEIHNMIFYYYQRDILSFLNNRRLLHWF